ncbi:MAG TPA: hypothetical protein VG476_00455, partial [Acidimicrobiales bacterium]|nr:hypothetical protein [Acidimicrobiales bacterium]
MTTFRDKLLEWLDATEADVADVGSTKVFVAVIGAAGLLMSGATVFGDLTRTVFPNAGAVQHVNLVHRKANELAAPVAQAEGATLPPPTVAKRTLRSRLFYLVFAAGFLALTLYEGIAGWFNWHRDTGFHVLGFGHFTNNIPWFAFFLFVAVCAVVLGLVCLAGLIWRTHTPRWAMSVIERTPLGVYR